MLGRLVPLRQHLSFSSALGPTGVYLRHVTAGPCKSYVFALALSFSAGKDSRNCLQ